MSKTEGFDKFIKYRAEYRQVRTRYRQYVKVIVPNKRLNLLDLQYLPILRQIYTNSKIGSFLFLNDLYPRAPQE